MQQGFVKIHRELTSWEWYHDLPVTRLLVHLILTSTHKDKKYLGVLLKAGQRVISTSGLATESGLSVKQVRSTYFLFITNAVIIFF
jgi:hypothetical protein